MGAVLSEFPKKVQERLKNYCDAEISRSIDNGRLELIPPFSATAHRLLIVEYKKLALQGVPLSFKAVGFSECSRVNEE
jgi:hypothetical protein